MRRRPLCLAAVFLLLILWMIPKEVWLNTPDLSSGELLTITGTVVKREQTEEKQIYYLKNCLCQQTNSKFSVLAYTQKGMTFPIGCQLSLYGTIYQLSPADNPGQFDGESYYQSQGILYTFQADSVLGSSGENYLGERIVRLREYLSGQLEEIFDERDAGIMKAVLLGDKGTLRDEDQLLYQKNGMSHLLAISGLHISMIGATFYKLLRKCHLTFVEAGIPSGMFVLVYGVLSGFGVSALRAICMFLVMLLGDILGRTYDMASALSLAVIIVLIRNPLQARQAGCLLSFGAVLGICCVYPILQSVWELEGKAAKAILFSLSMTLVTFPLCVHFFYEYPLYSILINFIVVPMMPVAMGFAGAGMCVSGIMPEIAKVIGIPAHLVLSFYECLGEWVVGFPGAVIRLGCEETWQLLLYYGLLILSLMGLWYGRKKIFTIVLPVALLMVSLRFRSELEFTVLDVGQGDCLFLRMPAGTTCLIDGGSTNVKNLGKYRILPYLKYEGVSELDYVIFTHLDEDHISGVRDLLEMYHTMDGIHIGQMLFPEIVNPDEKYEELWELAIEKGVEVGIIGAGDKIYEEDFLMECIYPIKERYAEDKNNSSTVLQVTYGKFSMLLSGDLGLEGEAELLHRQCLKDVDVWKVSHHGSKYSGGKEFLENIRPQLGLISVGRNTYGHPSTEVLERLAEVGCQVETTIESGALLLESDGEQFWLTLQRGED